MSKQNPRVIEEADNALHVQLNYGGIHFNPTESLKPLAQRPIQHDWQSGDLEDEIGKMRDIASAYLDLANALEGKSRQ